LPNIGRDNSNTANKNVLGGLDELDDLLDDLGGPSANKKAQAKLAPEIDEDDIDDLMFGRAANSRGS